MLQVPYVTNSVVSSREFQVSFYMICVLDCTGTTVFFFVASQQQHNGSYLAYDG